MPLIDIKFFVGNINLPGRSNSGTDEALNVFINKYEPIFLEKALGYTFYKWLTDAANVSAWDDLKNGKEYVVGGKTYRWQGLVVSVGEEEDATFMRISPIANYVYFYWMDANKTSTGNVGENKPLTANASQQNGVEKTAFAWNEMARILRTMHHYLDNSIDTYPTWDRCDVDKYLLRFTNSFGL